LLQTQKEAPTMSRYLVVTHKTADSQELLDRLRGLSAADPAAEFALLVPATPTHRLVSEVREDARAARERAATTAAHWLAHGLNVTSWHDGDANVVDAVRDRIATDARYAAIVIATLPPGVSRWLHLDAVRRISGLGRPVVHVVARSQQIGSWGQQHERHEAASGAFHPAPHAGRVLAGRRPSVQ
jgi:hypothetical protein